MPKYMLLLYANEGTAAEQQERAAEMPLWFELHESLTRSGLLVAGDQLAGTDIATTVRVRHGETEITDGPFAVTKEILGGYYVLECADLDEALAQAARVPLARYGSVEIRPVVDMTMPEPAAQAQEAGA